MEELIVSAGCELAGGGPASLERGLEQGGEEGIGKRARGEGLHLPTCKELLHFFLKIIFKYI